MTRDLPYIEQTKKWIEKVVIGLNLCPFAKRPYLENKIGFKVISGPDSPPVVNAVIEEALMLMSSSTIETSLIITPNLGLSFEPYYSFVSDLQDLLTDAHTPGIVLIAFHPEFSYADDDPNDTANATNRSPYSMIHLLKKSSLEEAANSPIDISALLANNKNLLSTMTWDTIRTLYK